MSVLNDLIKIKTSKKEDDLIKMLDEVSAYEKLSVDKNLKDLKTSAVARAKCPLLAGFADGNMYETVLGELAGNVYLQIEGIVPDVLAITEERTQKREKQIKILEQSIFRVDYRELAEYDNETMEDMLAAVFTRKYADNVLAVLIVRHPSGYTMYHGSYTISGKGTEKKIRKIYNPVITKGKHGRFTLYSYSVLGNNGYRFGSYEVSDAVYDVMIGPDNIMYVMQKNVGNEISLSREECNDLNIAKKNPYDFADQVVSIIDRRLL